MAESRPISNQPHPPSIGAHHGPEKSGLSRPQFGTIETIQAMDLHEKMEGLAPWTSALPILQRGGSGITIGGHRKATQQSPNQHERTQQIANKSLNLSNHE